MDRGYGRKGRFRYRLLVLTIVYIVIGAAASFAVLYILNNNASAQAEKQAQLQAQIAAPTPTPTPAPTQSAYAQKLTVVPADTKSLYFSFDGKYCAYTNDSGLVAIDTAGNKTLKTLPVPGIVWAQFIEGRDIILYLTQDGTTVSVHTYNIESDTDALQTAITVPANSKVKDAAFSSAKNFMCLNIETGTDSFSDEIHTVDIMKRTTRLTLQNIINNLVLLNKTEQVYYTDSKGSLYYGNKVVPEAGTGTLLGSDNKDNVYFQTSGDKSVVYVIADGKNVKTLQLQDMPDFLRFYRTESTVYGVYDGYLADLAGDVSVLKPFDKGLDFMGIGGSITYFRNAAGEILGTRLG